jgi:hypothetical protein
MARPPVADGEDGLQIWRVAANILNNQSRTAGNGWPSSLRIGRGANNSSPKKKKKQFIAKCYRGPQRT